MAIKVRYTKEMVDGEKVIVIQKLQALRSNQLPVKYKRGIPRAIGFVEKNAAKKEIINVIAIRNKEIYMIREGDRYDPDTLFNKIIPDLKAAGMRLTAMKWTGSETIVI